MTMIKQRFVFAKNYWQFTQWVRKCWPWARDRNLIYVSREQQLLGARDEEVEVWMVGEFWRNEVYRTSPTLDRWVGSGLEYHYGYEAIPLKLRKQEKSVNHKIIITYHAADVLAERGDDLYIHWYEETAKLWGERQEALEDHWHFHYEGCGCQFDIKPE